MEDLHSTHKQHNRIGKGTRGLTHMRELLAGMLVYSIQNTIVGDTDQFAVHRWCIVWKNLGCVQMMGLHVMSFYFFSFYLELITKAIWMIYLFWKYFLPIMTHFSTKKMLFICGTTSSVSIDRIITNSTGLNRNFYFANR